MTTDISKRSTIADVLSLTVGCAVVSALIFCVRAAYLLTLGGGFAGVSRDFVWMSPLSYLFLYGVLTVPLIVLAWFMERERAFKIAVFVLVTFGAFDVAIPFSAIATLATFVLAMGLGSWAARRSAGASRRVAQSMRRVAGGGAVVLAGAAVVAAVVTPPSRSGRQAGTGSVAGAPNVLLIIWDTVRAAQISLNGYEKETTPGLAALASRGAVFEAAMATAPWTLASHGTMFTGRYPQYLSTDRTQKLDGSEPTLAEAFGKAGYRTVGISANVAYASWESGLERGFAEYQDYKRGLRQTLRSSLFGQTTLFGALVSSESLRELKAQLQRPLLFFIMKPTRVDERDAQDVTDSFLHWRSKQGDGKPYFAFLNYIDAHKPYRPPASYQKRYAKRRSQLNLYDAEIAYIDHEVARLLSDLERRGDLKNTLVIITSDHGEHFGERDLHEHSNSVYTQTIHVPLVMRFDGRIPAGTRVRPVVSLKDLGATALEYAGITPTPAFPGASLARYWTSAADSGSTAIAQLGRNGLRDLSIPDSIVMEAAVFDDRWHLVRTGTRPLEELFDYRADPAETRSLIGADSARGVPERLRALLQKSLEADKPPNFISKQRLRGKARPLPPAPPA